MSPERLYTIRELSELTGKPEHFLRDAIKRGFLLCHQHCNGGRIHVTISQWQDYLDGTLVGARNTDPSRGQRARGAGRVRRAVRRSKGSTFNGINKRDPRAYAEMELA